MTTLAALGPEVLIPLFATVVAALVGYLAAARQFSGKIESSEAESLWNESRSIREYLNDQVRLLNQRIAALEDQLRACHDHITELEREAKRV